MPSYDYFCAANHRTVEVRHSMSAAVSTWGELAELAGIDAGDTPAETPVERLIRGSYVSTGSSAGTSSGGGPQHGCGPGSCGCGKY